MNHVFNTPFEIALRVLLTLEITGGQGKTTDMIAATDFITIYGKDFGISDENLHGDNNYKFSEFALRRELVKAATKRLVLNNLICVSPTQKGFTYSISQNGLAYSAKLTSDYANAYRDIARLAQLYIVDKSEREVLEIINQRSLSSLQRSMN
ncbi:hypothetical protein SCACP_26040 [Sporomusa carbonis]|jgi:hypothetical protein|uniref:ABC-three component system middle component 2 n=1 Tax=Sporomusa carbonis TaxID=3076075 RepID=UPI003A6F6037